MTPDRARKLLQINEANSQEEAIERLPTFLLLLAAELADYAKNWPAKDTREHIIIRGAICLATRDLAKFVVGQAQACLEELTPGYSGLSGEVYNGHSGDNPLPKLKTRPLGTQPGTEGTSMRVRRDKPILSDPAREPYSLSESDVQDGTQDDTPTDGSNPLDKPE